MKQQRELASKTARSLGGRHTPVVFSSLHPRRHGYGLFFLVVPIGSDLTIPCPSLITVKWPPLTAGIFSLSPLVQWISNSAEVLSPIPKWSRRSFTE